MRIVELHLDAFGPFTDRRLRFADRKLAMGDPAQTGLCVVYGANEAGKSSALRAIRGLLYGIPQQSEDNFVHRHQDLRIGATLCFRDGLCADVVRRKGKKQTLAGEGRDAERVIDLLSNLTQAIPESLFSHFYGLDHPALVEGSRALLEDGGQIGRALLGAGLGVVHLRKLIESLEQEADALFVPRGQKQRIAIALSDWKDIKDEIRSSTLDPGRWEEQARFVESVAARLAGLEEELESTRAELSRARRLKEARQALAQAEEERESALARIEKETERGGALVLMPEILAAREPIELLHQNLESFRAARVQLPRREEKVAELEVRIADLEQALGSELGSASEATHRGILQRAARVRELVVESARCEDRLEKAIEAEAEARAEWAQCERRSDASVRRDSRTEPDPESLGRAIERAHKLGAIDEEIDEARRRLAEQGDEAARFRERLGLGHLQVDELETLALPSEASIALHVRRFTEHAEAKVRLHQGRMAVVEEKLEVAEQLGRLRAVGSLPSEAELLAERRTRDDLWQGLRDRLSGSAPPAAVESPSLELGGLGSRYEERVRSADQLADRLRSEAERVAAAASLVARTARLEQALLELERDEQHRDAEGLALEEAWQCLWPAPLGAPGMPETRLEWRARVDKLFELFVHSRELSGRLARLEGSRREARLAIRAVLSSEGATDASSNERLEPWIERAEIERTRQRDAQESERAEAQACEQAERQVERAVRGREQAAAQIERWRSAWQSELAALALPLVTRARDAEAHLDTIQNLLERRRECDEIRRRVAQMHEIARRFESECGRLMATCLPEVADFSAEGAALRLKRQLEQAQEHATLSEAARTALAEAQDALGQAERRLLTRSSELRELAGGQGRGTTEPDPPLEIDLDRLTARIASLEVRQREQLDERTECVGELRLARAALEAMDGNARIAELAERAESRLAQVRNDVRRYAELRLARQILEQEIDDYRRQNQGPLLAHAGQLFGELTRGAYPSILSDAGDDGRARLVAVSAGQREVPVEALSAGTRDQLFLALRLATLAASIERSEPMPLIADDILIEFDDDRTRATLEVLARFGERTQILLFSHHRHVADLAASLGDRARLVSL